MLRNSRNSKLHCPEAVLLAADAFHIGFVGTGQLRVCRLMTSIKGLGPWLGMLLLSITIFSTLNTSSIDYSRLSTDPPSSIIPLALALILI